MTQDALRHMTSDQLDFRDETLKKKVETKAFEQDALKTKSAEQKDFRSETLKSKVVTKAYKEEEIKVVDLITSLVVLCIFNLAFFISSRIGKTTCASGLPECSFFNKTE